MSTQDISQPQVLMMRLRSEEFAIEISDVHEVAGRMDMTVVHEPTGLIRGVVNLRGRVVTVLDLSLQLGWGAYEDTCSRSSRIVFIKLQHKVFGFMVDQVSDLLQLSNGQAGPDIKSDRAVISPRFLKSSRRSNQGAVDVLDLAKIFSTLIKE